jgi:hypothetical protein
MVRELEVSTTLSSCGDFHENRAIDGVDFNLCAECCIHHIDVFFAEYDVAFASEVFMRLNADMNIKVAFVAVGHSLTAALQSNRRSVIDAGWDFEFDSLLGLLCSRATANRTDFFRNLASTTTRWAGDGLLDGTKDRIHDPLLLARALAGRARFHLVTRLNRGAFTVFTLIIKAEMKFFFDTEDSVLEGQVNCSLNIPSTTWALLLLAPSEETPEDVAESTITKIKVDILTAKSAEAFKWITARPTAAISTDASMTELIIALTFLGILQDFVCFRSFFEFRLVATFFVWVVLDGSLAKRLLDFISGGVFGDTENFVIIAF